MTFTLALLATIILILIGVVIFMIRVQKSLYEQIDAKGDVVAHAQYKANEARALFERSAEALERAQAQVETLKDEYRRIDHMNHAFIAASTTDRQELAAANHDGQVFFRQMGERLRAEGKDVETVVAWAQEAQFTHKPFVVALWEGYHAEDQARVQAKKRRSEAARVAAAKRRGASQTPE